MSEYISKFNTTEGLKAVDYNALGNLPASFEVSNTEPEDDKVMVWIQPEVGEDDNTLVTPIAMGGTGADNAADARQALQVVGKADALSLEEIEASTDLNGKVVEASALKRIVKLIDTPYGNVVCTKFGSLVSLYADFKNLPTDQTGVTVTTKIPPVIRDYGVGTCYAHSVPYAPVGAAWVYTSGNLLIDKPIADSSVYMYTTYITSET